MNNAIVHDEVRKKQNREHVRRWLPPSPFTLPASRGLASGPRYSSKHEHSQYEQQNDDGQKHEEQHSRYVGRYAGNAGKAKDAGNDRDQTKHQRPFEQRHSQASSDQSEGWKTG